MNRLTIFSAFCCLLISFPLIASADEKYEQTIKLVVYSSGDPEYSDQSTACGLTGFKTTDVFDFPHYAGSGCQASNNYSDGPKNYYIVSNGVWETDSSCDSYVQNVNSVIQSSSHRTESQAGTLTIYVYAYEMNNGEFNYTNCSTSWTAS